jgi:hypothetical protein
VPPAHADFHSLRHSYVALLDRAGVSLEQAMQLARHSDPRLTMARYGRAQIHDLGAAVERLPSLVSGTGPSRESLRATGTDPAGLSPCTDLVQVGDGGRGNSMAVAGEGASGTDDATSAGERLLRAVEGTCVRLRAESPGRDSHPHFGFGDRDADGERVPPTSTSGGAPSSVAPQLLTRSGRPAGAENAPADADLARVAAAWRDLPPHIKAAVLVVVDSAGR